LVEQRACCWPAERRGDGAHHQEEAVKDVAKLSQVIQIDEGKLQEHLGEVVRSTVEKTLNAEADGRCRAEWYERTEARKETRAGSYLRAAPTDESGGR
jgi:transposase-like protein